MRSPILPITLAFAAGIVFAPFTYFSGSQLLFWIAVLLFCACALLRLSKYREGLLLAWMGFALAGAFLAKFEHSYLPSQHMEMLARRKEIQIDAPMQLEGWAASATVRRPGGEYFDLNLTRLTQAEKARAAEGIVRIYYFAPKRDRPSLEIENGQRVAVAVRDLRRPRNYMTEGQYDFEAAERRQGIYFTGAIRASRDLSILTGGSGGWLLPAVSKLRSRLLANLDRLFPRGQDPGGYGPILKAMILGDDNWLPAGVQTAFQESGTYHLLVVAGLHVSALALGVFWMVSLFRLADWVAVSASLVCTFAFVLLTGSQLPAVRAALMIALYLVTRLFYRKRALLNSIATAALILLLAHPSDIFSASFQLSFLSVTIIACMAVPMAEWTFAGYRSALDKLEDEEAERRLSPRHAQFRHDFHAIAKYIASKLPELARARIVTATAWAGSGILAIADVFLAAAFIQLGLTLSMVIYFHRVAWSGLLANPLVIPIATLVVPIGFVVLCASLLWWPLAVAGSKVLAGLILLLHGIVDHALRLPQFERRVAEPPMILEVGFVLVLLLFAFYAARRSRLVWLPLMALVVLDVVLSIAPYRPQLRPGRLEMTALDVGQGDSLFLTLPGGATMLVDGGGAIVGAGDEAPTFDVGERIVAPFLWARRIRRLDYVVLTHAHSDHLGGLDSIFRNFQIGELWIGQGPSDRMLDNLLNLAKSKGVPIRTLSSPQSRNLNGVAAEILSPPSDWMPPKVSNNDSVVMRFAFGSRHLLLPGDAERPIENRLVEGAADLRSEVLKVGHHGSKTSTTAPFLQRVAPQFGIISVGAFHRFGHPNQEVLDALERAGVRAYRTDRDGSITISTDGNRIEISTFRDAIASWPSFAALPTPVSLWSTH